MKQPALWLCVALVCGACKSHSNDAATKPAASASASAVSSARAAPKPPFSLATIPTEEDYEDEAEQQITSQNLDSELDKLEKELKNP